MEILRLLDRIKNSVGNDCEVSIVTDSHLGYVFIIRWKGYALRRAVPCKFYGYIFDEFIERLIEEAIRSYSHHAGERGS